MRLHRRDAEIGAEFNATEDLRGGMGWETWKNAPKNGGRPEGTRPERLRYGAATKDQRVAERFPERKPARQNLRAQRKRRNAVWRHRVSADASGSLLRMASLEKC